MHHSTYPIYTPHRASSVICVSFAPHKVAQAPTATPLNRHRQACSPQVSNSNPSKQTQTSMHPSQSLVSDLSFHRTTQSRSSTNSNPSKQTQTSLQPTCLTEKAPLLEIQIESPQHCSRPHTDTD